MARGRLNKKKKKYDEEVEILVLGNILVIVGGIAGATGFLTLWSGGGLAVIGLVMFSLGLWMLWQGFRKWQLPLLKENFALVGAMYKERLDR